MHSCLPLGAAMSRASAQDENGQQGKYGLCAQLEAGSCPAAGKYLLPMLLAALQGVR